MHVQASDMIEALRRSGLRITASRRAICEVLATDHDQHLTAGDLLEKVNRRLRGSVAPSTIYRTIDALEGEGLLRHVHVGRGPALLHLSDDTTHHHLVCELCGSTTDINTGAFDAAVKLVAARNGFLPDSIHYALIGRCESCAATIATQLQ